MVFLAGFTIFVKTDDGWLSQGDDNNLPCSHFWAWMTNPLPTNKNMLTLNGYMSLRPYAKRVRQCRGQKTHLRYKNGSFAKYLIQLALHQSFHSCCHPRNQSLRPRNYRRKRKMSATPKLFQEIKVGDVILKHRVAMAPLTRLRANYTHVPLDIVREHYEQRANTPGAGFSCL
jgi:hypothetical protein